MYSNTSISWFYEVDEYIYGMWLLDIATMQINYIHPS